MRCLTGKLRCSGGTHVHHHFWLRLSALFLAWRSSAPSVMANHMRGDLLLGLSSSRTRRWLSPEIWNMMATLLRLHKHSLHAAFSFDMRQTTTRCQTTERPSLTSMSESIYLNVSCMAITSLLWQVTSPQVATIGSKAAALELLS